MLAVITATLIVGDGLSLPELAVIIVMAGAIQVVLGLAGVGRYVSYMPHIVLTGFMTGIGVLILATQVEKLFRLGTSDVALAALCLAVFFLWPARIGKLIPAPLAAVGIGWNRCALPARVSSSSALSRSGLPIPVLEVPSLDFLPKAVGPAVLIALISSVYTLMWSLIADTFTSSQHNPNRELFGLGLGNLAAGVVGVMPGSGTIATMTAHRFGGKNRRGRHRLPDHRRGAHSGSRSPTWRRCRWRRSPRSSCSSAGG